MKVQEKRVEEDNCYMFKRSRTTTHPSVMALPTPRLLRTGLGVWRNCSTYFNALRSEKLVSPCFT